MRVSPGPFRSRVSSIPGPLLSRPGLAGAVTPGSCRSWSRARCSTRSTSRLPYTQPDNYTVASRHGLELHLPERARLLSLPGQYLLQYPPRRVELWPEHGRLVRLQPKRTAHSRGFLPEPQPANSPISPMGPRTRSWPARSRFAAPSTIAFPGLSNINNPASVPDPTANPYVVAPEYGGTCGAVGQSHTAWVDGNAQETGMTTAWPPNKQILGQHGEGDLDLQGTPALPGRCGPRPHLRRDHLAKLSPRGRQRGALPTAASGSSSRRSPVRHGEPWARSPAARSSAPTPTDRERTARSSFRHASARYMAGIVLARYGPGSSLAAPEAMYRDRRRSALA